LSCVTRNAAPYDARTSLAALTSGNRTKLSSDCLQSLENPNADHRSGIDLRSDCGAAQNVWLSFALSPAAPKSRAE
jgi:hypothetical protein